MKDVVFELIFALAVYCVFTQVLRDGPVDSSAAGQVPTIEQAAMSSTDTGEIELVSASFEALETSDPDRPVLTATAPIPMPRPAHLIL